MTDRPIPESVRAKARDEAQFFAAWLHAGNSSGSLSEHAIDGLADSIAHALIDERERAAKIAETEGVYPELNIYAGGPDWYRHGRRVAAAIRKG